MPPSGPASAIASTITRTPRSAYRAGSFATIRTSSATAESAASWRSMMRAPPITSDALSAPPKRRARPPARMAPDTDPVLGATLDLIMIVLWSRSPRPSLCHDRVSNWTRARRKSAPGDRGSVAHASRILRELAERGGPARGDDRTGAADGGPELPAHRGPRLQPHHGARRRIRGGVDVRERAAHAAPAGARAAGRAPGAGGAALRARPREGHLSELARDHSRQAQRRHHRPAWIALLRGARDVARAAVRVLCVRDCRDPETVRRVGRGTGERVSRGGSAQGLRPVRHARPPRRQRGGGMIGLVTALTVCLATA